MKIFKKIKITDLLNKDIIYINNLSSRAKKLVIYYIIFYFIIFYIEIIKMERIILFIFLLCLFLLYKIIIELIIYYFDDNKNLRIFINENNNKFNKVVKILLFLQKWKNPLLILLVKIDKFYFKIFRWFIYQNQVNKKIFFINYNLYDITFLQYFVLNIILGPLKIFFGFFYNILKKAIEMPFSLFLITRSLSFILNVFIFSDLFFSIYNNLGITFIYFFLIFLSLIIKHLDRDFEFLKIQYLTRFISTDYLIFIRNNVTIIGIFIIYISAYKIEGLNKCYIDTMSSYLKSDIEECFYKHWEYYKRNFLLVTINIWKEIKNRPSFYLYSNFIYWITIGPTFKGPNSITNILFFKYKVEKLKLKLPEDIQEDLDYLYQVNFLRFKLLLFMVWDIDNYIGNKNWNYITYEYNEIIDGYYIGCDSSIYNYNDLSNFKVEEKKEDFPFYDPESNMEFFDRLYLIIGIVPFISNPLHTQNYSEILRKYRDLMNNIRDRLNAFHIEPKDLLRETWIRREENDDLDINNINLIENKIKDWIIEFLKESRIEWELISRTEKDIELRNFKMLNEIEDFLLKRK
jgi:hypothetical protein